MVLRRSEAVADQFPSSSDSPARSAEIIRRPKGEVDTICSMCSSHPVRLSRKYPDAPVQYGKTVIANRQYRVGNGFNIAKLQYIIEVFGLAAA